MADPLDNRLGHGGTQVPPNTFHGSFIGSNVGGSNNTFINVHTSKSPTVFDLLNPHIAADALYNSRKREEEHASICQPETRTKILQIIRQWVDGEGHAVCWLRGPAGTGKSTIAHTIAEEFSRTGLAATFFFARKRGDREDINKLIPTLAYQIAENIPATKRMILTALENDRMILDKRLHHQFSTLVIEPIASIELANRSLMILDGLDECSSRHDILELIRLLGEVIKTLDRPFRFLLTSRPEHDIEAAFRLHITTRTSLWLALEDSKEDVRKYLRENLLKVRGKFSRVMQSEAELWPGESVLDHLVGKSEGLFIHATTAVQYIGDGKGLPQKKLQTVLRVHKGLDPLYAQVIADAQEFENFDIVMGNLMYLREPLTIDGLSQLLGFDVNEIRIALDGCPSILVIPEDDHSAVQPYHASLRDYLTSHERSQHLFCAPAKFHSMLLMQCLKNITSARAKNEPPHQYACTDWFHHGFLLLSEEIAPPVTSTLEDAGTEVEQIDLKWVEYWMAEALVWIEPEKLRVDLPSTDVPEAYQTLYIKATKINMIVNDVSRDFRYDTLVDDAMLSKPIKLKLSLWVLTDFWAAPN